ncbi:extracellular solute-binding protein [Paenibacillus sp. N5-1-1-5]|uniref:Extracellular solute-binding protein n=2 Tax=Paenibacillus radicis (ex Xue et al. 2023) TaxID=2972489 RepID=A0ABT1YHC6_9BACL|nr:extracellular solute-binding protein [Paenibacillus radicis (ex Xue et al. 2023)]MCR8632586.1 extracellular solute-binding protein [Paenibacillus radicis (ex Xue et al. 2023)]
MNMQARNFRWLNALSILALVTGIVAGCSPASNNEKKEAKSSKAQPQSNKITIMVNLQTPVVPSDKIEKLIEEKTGMDIKFEWVPDGTYDEKFQAAFATNSLPQAAYIKNQSSFIQLRDAIKSQQFWEIGPYLKDYPNLSKLNKETLNNTAVDGKIYSLYKERPLARQGIIYRKDWADKLGLQAPKTTDDIYNMLKKFKESQAGGPKTVPLADRNDLIYGSFKTLSSYFGTPNGWGVENGKLVPEFMTKGYMDTMKFVKKLRDEGLINQDFPVTSKTDQQNMMYTGTSGMYIGALTDAGVIQDKTSKNVKEAQYDVANQILGTNGKPGVWALPGYGTLVMFPKSAVKSEAELKQILTFFDKWFDKDIVNYLKYGVEGEHYTLKDGKVVPNADTKLLEKDVKPYSTLALTDSMNVLPLLYNIPVEEKGFKLSDEAVNFAVQDPTVPLNSPTFNEKGARIGDIIKDATYKFMLGKIDETGFQADVKKWQDEGGAKIIDEYNAAFKGGK